MALTGALLALVAGTQWWQGRAFGVFLVFAPICMMPGNATGSAGDPMTRVVRLKAQDEAAAR